MYCENCKKEIVNSAAQFCPYCGKALQSKDSDVCASLILDPAEAPASTVAPPNTNAYTGISTLDDSVAKTQSGTIQNQSAPAQNPPEGASAQASNPFSEDSSNTFPGYIPLPAVSDKHSKKKRLLFIIIPLAGVLAVILGAFFFSFLLGQVGKPNFNDLCGKYSTQPWCEISEDGTWMRLDTNPDDMDSDLSFLYRSESLSALSAIEETNEALGFSGAVLQRMQETTALNGVQTEESDSCTVTWTYHPDNGLEVIYEIK